MRQSSAYLALAMALLSWPSAAAAETEDADRQSFVETVIVTARLRPESAQAVPGSLSVVDGGTLKATTTNGVAQIIQLVPSLNYTSPNPRNTALTIRGLGSSVVAIAQSNDGLEPGVGFYVDQVYRARPAAAAFDFLDVQQIEVLRGPQGTLFGKNTTAGAINIRSKAPTFDRTLQAELTAGNFGYRQGKVSLNAPIWGEAVAARLSMVATSREGLIRNIATGARHNAINNVAIQGQVLIRPAEGLSLRLTVDGSSIDANCCTQVFVRVGETLRPAARQYPALAGALNYRPASTDPYRRVTDIDAALKVDTNEGGVSGIADWDIGDVTLTSVSAWRWWNWSAANDRDYIGLPIQLLQGIPSRQDQYSQEFRIASNGRRSLEYVAGLYAFSQTISGRPQTGYGPLATYWLLGPEPAFPRDLLNGYTTNGRTRFHSESYAVFGEATWRLSERFNLTGGLRYTYETKNGRFDSTVSGGLAATGALLNSKLSILRPQSYRARDKDGSVSGRVVAAYDLAPDLMVYASYARASKSGGINMSGLPLDASNAPALTTAVVKPERNTTSELGLKSELLQRRLILNADIFETQVRDFQANVVDSAPGALRGYLANIEKVRVRGLEVEGAVAVSEHLTGRFGFTRTDGRYVSYRNGPCPLERIGNATSVCDLSGKLLPTLPKFVWSASGEFKRPLRLGPLHGEGFLTAQVFARTRVSGDPTASRYTVIDGYRLVNGVLGLRSVGSWEASLWVRNLFDQHYLQNVTVQAGNSGLVVGTPGDPRTVGLTLSATY